MKESIIMNPNVCFGSPTIKGRRLTMYDIVSSLKYDSNLDEYAKEFSLSLNIIKDVLEYCSGRKCIINKCINFCDGCSLRVQQDKPLQLNEKIEDFEKVGEGVWKYDNGIFLGNLEDIEEEVLGYNTWITAKELLKKNYCEND